ncbi:hypothetical protein HRR90_002431 [Exophiala dermatitidis]|uniref:HhH-GPD domain-containing protein n=1 Tax=Exophiala dermatitidis TaxID=5970 RepID=A0AAN6EVH6_EXODE|nr:hypothetical protein HRR73_004225 [Exophiala dermatitidis]KAJ4534157.1 hypothetical protein HRR76_006091 [Exophiala dermatitidis]KAJ4550310.1 hypothetical protein HRR77_003777 [Exophiala dermatitidis]KAJ4563438.1 hypothetical protein HRR79_006318 [Exophiala dermatitidis]KAJ4622104.1 hypothetical protein HRR88_005786 [Exophiala dermatitidis]
MAPQKRKAGMSRVLSHMFTDVSNHIKDVLQDKEDGDTTTHRNLRSRGILAYFAPVAAQPDQPDVEMEVVQARHHEVGRNGPNVGFLTLKVKKGYKIPEEENSENGRNVGFLTLKLSPGYNYTKAKKWKPKPHLKQKPKEPVYKKPKLPKRKTKHTNKYRFEFGEDRLYDHPKPTCSDLAIVAEILRKERTALKSAAQSMGTSSSPGIHAGNKISIDSIVRVILSQSCTNEAALDAQQTLMRAYPYNVGGIAVAGRIPNYHAMRVQSPEKLTAVLTKTGLQKLKGGSIKRILDAVYEINVARLQPGEVVYDGNEPGVAEFVPGLLSMEYVYEALAQGGKQAVFDCLVKLPQIGIKSACCLMGFNMNLPVFAVDTHVAGMAKLLG